MNAKSEQKNLPPSLFEAGLYHLSLPSPLSFTSVLLLPSLREGPSVDDGSPFVAAGSGKVRRAFCTAHLSQARARAHMFLSGDDVMFSPPKSQAVFKSCHWHT